MPATNRKAILLGAFIIAIYSVKAQDYVRPAEENYPSTRATPIPGNKKFSLAINIGAAIPMQDFGSTNVKNSFWDFTSVDSTRLQGFAKTGFHFNITASYRLFNNWGITMLIGNNANAFDINTFSSTIGYPAGNSSTSYSTAEYLIGPYFSFPAGNKLFIKVSALAGLVTNSYPPVDITLNDTTSIEINFTAGRGFGYSLGAGIAYSVSSNVNVLLNIAYTGALIKYNGWTETVSFTGYYPFAISHANDVANMPTGIIKPTIGIEFKL